eukprot:Skav219853  [mRNA]  locus=scaffold859:602867:603214:- [translate_table: standard]
MASARTSPDGTWLVALLREAQLRPFDDLVERIRPMMSSDLDLSVRKARCKASALSTQFPSLSEEERAIITLLMDMEKSLYQVLNGARRGGTLERRHFVAHSNEELPPVTRWCTGE